MGASTFVDFASKKEHASAQEAFDCLVEESQYESGHSYSGQIGMKNGFKRAKVNVGYCASKKEAIELADRLLDEEDDTYGDKWDPAWMVECDEGWVFFGWASS